MEGPGPAEGPETYDTSSDDRRDLIDASRSDSSKDSSEKQEVIGDEGSLRTSAGVVSKEKYGERSLRSSRHSVEPEQDSGQGRAHSTLAICSIVGVAFMLQLIKKYVNR